MRSAIRVSQRSYSIKKLEPLYMEAREAAVTNAADSIVVYHQFMAARDAERFDDAARLIAEIADYNRDDCVSTWMLRDWLLAQGAAADPAGSAADPSTGTEVGPAQTPSEQRLALMNLETLLRDRLVGIKPHERTPEEQAVALVAASVLFHAREDKPVWQAHFERLRLPVGDWRVADGVFLVESAEVVTPWHAATARQRPRRTLRLQGEPMRGIPAGPGDEVSAVYLDPPPPGITTLPGHANARSSATIAVLEAVDSLAPNGRLHQSLLVEELQPKDGGAHNALPVALVPSKMLSTKPIDDALAEVAQRVVDADHGLPRAAGIDLLARRLPRLRGDVPLPGVGVGPTRHVDAIEAALLATDDSYLAVQGPPGTGKTYVASRVIARLVLDHGWAVGVTSQGHKAIENVLRAVVAAGVPPEQVGKATRDPEGATWTPLAKADDLAEFAAGHARAGQGYVVGGTAWDLTSTRRVGRGQLDLVVVDEAGQFSLAKTLACSVAGARLLLLGDPQQLPQVSQGTHPDPVDASALGWLIGDEPVLSPTSATSSRRPGGCTRPSPTPSPACRMPASCSPRRRSPPRVGSRASSRGCTCASSTTTTTRRGPPRRRTSCATWCTTCSGAPGTTRPSAGPTALRSVRARWGPPTSSSSRPTTARSGSCAAPSTTPASPRCRSARSTSSRARRRLSRSCRWRPRRTPTSRGAWASCSTGTGSTSRSRAASTAPTSYVPPCSPTSPRAHRAS